MSVCLNGRAFDVVPFDLDGEPGVSGELFGYDGETGELWRMMFWLPETAVAELEAIMDRVT